MNPQINRFRTNNRVGLSAFIFMMRKTKVNSTNMHINMVS